MTQTYLREMIILSVLTGLLLAATVIALPEHWSVYEVYGYWLGRILIEAGLFISILQMLLLFPGFRLHPTFSVIIASGLSFIPFSLSIIALNIILGLPEFGTTLSSYSQNASLFATSNLLVSSAVAAVNPLEIVAGARPQDTVDLFIVEVAYLVDNHVALTALIASPLFLFGSRKTPETPLPYMTPSGSAASRPTGAIEFEAASGHLQSGPPRPAAVPKKSSFAEVPFFQKQDPPFTSDIIHIEAQEHYVRLVATDDTRMVLSRFSDIILGLPEELGMRVHRSHWVAHDKVSAVFKDGSNLKIRMTNGALVPVSRKYAKDVMRRYKSAFGTSRTPPSDGEKQQSGLPE